MNDKGAQAPRGRWSAWSRRLAMATLLAGLAPVASAGAAVATGRLTVTITPSQVAVRSGADTAVVQRNPFRLRILGAAGAAALSEVANVKPAPDAVPSTMDLLPPGTDAPKSEQLYAPLSFLVGQESYTQYIGGVWSGNLMSGSYSGIQYAARKVIAARRSGSGAILTLSTDDPSGRTLPGGDPAGRRRPDPGVRDPSPGHRRGDDERLVRVLRERGVLRVRRPAQRAEPARTGLLQLGRRGEHSRARSARHTRGNPLPERSYRRLLRAGTVHLLSRLRVPAGPAAALLVPARLRSTRRVEHRDGSPIAHLCGRSRNARAGDWEPDLAHRSPAGAAALGAGSDDGPSGQEQGRDPRETIRRTSTRTSPTSTATTCR